MPDQELLRIPLVVSTNAKDAALVTSEKSFTRHNMPDRRNRLIVVREGHLQIQIDETVYDLAADHALIIKAGTPFTRLHAEDSLLRYYAIRFSVDGELSDCIRRVDIPIATTLGRPDLVEKLFRLFLNEQCDKLDQHLFAQLVFMQILSEVADGERRKDVSNQRCIPVVERAKAHIRAHYDRPISTSTVAKSVDCSPGYLSRAFQAATNSTVTAFIHEVRLFRARMLLTETNKSIAQIAHECGFENPGYFQRLFHRYEGTSPGDYRKQNSRIYTITIE